MNYNQKILEKAIAMSANGGYTRLTRDGVASAAGVSAGMVNKCFGTIDGLRRAVMAEAIRTEDLSVLAQGLACGSEEARKASKLLKHRALEYLSAL